MRYSNKPGHLHVGIPRGQSHYQPLGRASQALLIRDNISLVERSLVTWCDRTIDLLLVASCGCSGTRRGLR